MIISFRIPPVAAAVLSVLGTVHAIDAGGIAIHGSLSETAAYSGKYNYYGETAEHVDLISSELTLNGTYRFENGLRVAAQVYAYELAGYNDLTIDFATLDYSFNEFFGIRVGRNKMPQGFYGELIDLDTIRTFASLPLNVYPRSFRTLSNGYNGTGIYGSVPLKKAGNIEYQAYFGWMDNISGDAPYSKGRNDLTETDNVVLDQVYGGGLVWNSPVEGLRFGYTYTFLPDIEVKSHVQTRAQLAAIGSSYAAKAAAVDGLYGAGVWDHSGLFAGSAGLIEADVTVQLLSAEYSHDKWIVSAEYKTWDTDGLVNVKAAAPFSVVNMPISSPEEHWYGQVTYQATDKLGLGVYYAQSDFDPENKDPRDNKFTSMDDLALATSYAITGNWLVKFEAHALDGLGKLGLAGDRNVGATDPKWNYFVVKATFSF